MSTGFIIPLVFLKKDTLKFNMFQQMIAFSSLQSTPIMTGLQLFVCKLCCLLCTFSHTCKGTESQTFLNTLGARQKHVAVCSHDNFAIIDQTSPKFALKIKEALHILWEKPTLDEKII